MNAIENQVRELVKIELAAANERFPQFHSAHEGYAVLKEEVEELEYEVGFVQIGIKSIWSDIKANQTHKWEVEVIRKCAINAACEAIQVAAMCQKFLEMENGNG